MKRIALTILLIATLEISNSNATENLISACITDSLASCKLTEKSKNFETIKKYEKAFSCISRGSTSGETFKVNIPIPDFAALGFDIGSKAQHSSKTCNEEIKKLDDIKFVEDFKESFSKDCGNVVLGTTEACINASVISGAPHSQQFKCAIDQRSNSIVINNVYSVAFKETPADYKIRSVIGIDGMSCDENAYAGVNNYNSLFCRLPESYGDSKVVVTLGNGINCAVDVTTNINREPKDAKRYSCANVFNSLPDGGDIPTLMKASIVGLCDLCLDQNLSTPSHDQRSLSNRIQGCAIWAVKISAKSRASTCEVVKSTTPVGTFQIPAPTYGGGVGMSPGDPLVLATSPGTERGPTISLMPMSEQAAAQSWVSSLCNNRKEGEVLEYGGTDWKSFPIDYLESSDGKSPEMAGFVDSIKKILNH